jgi:hypothetical protein
MHDVIQKLTPRQAFEVVLRLRDRGGAIHDAVLAEARDVLIRLDLDEIADDVFVALDSINVQDCWDRAGSSSDGYTSPDEAAGELIEESLQPFYDQARRYHELEMTEEEATYCKGVILGIYRYEQESKSEFLECAVDIPSDCADVVLDGWRIRGQNSTATAAMSQFIRDRCPIWSKALLRTKGRR